MANPTTRQWAELMAAFEAAGAPVRSVHDGADDHSGFLQVAVSRVVKYTPTVSQWHHQSVVVRCRGQRDIDLRGPSRFHRQQPYQPAARPREVGMGERTLHLQSCVPSIRR